MATLDETSFRTQWASRFIRKDFARIQQDAQAVPTHSADQNHLLPIANFRQSPVNVDGFKVAIIGAGAAGLFTAMIFDYLNDQFPGLNVKYELLEGEQERSGGRLFTYKFPQQTDQPKPGPHDYYDVGAMRFPDVKTMRQTFALFKELDMKYVNTDEPDNTETPQPGDLIPYHFIGNNQPNLYNGIVVPVLDKKNPPALTAEAFEIPDIPPHLQTVDSGKIIEREIDDLLKKYGTSPTDFWDTLLKDVDPFSVRQYFTTQTQEKLDYKTLEMCETLNFGNRWYDQACSEMVLESLDFDPKAKWWCVEGGAAEIAKRMMEKVKHKEAVQFGKSVNAISYNQTDEQAWKVDVTVDGEQGPRPPYDAVFNSVPLGAMQHMHLEGLNLNWGQKSAIRSLGYGASCKVGIRFKTLWWKKEGFSDGGVGKTDLPIRCCVYPSYNLHDPAEEPGVLLASYTWSQEAERIGALIDQQSPSNEDRLKKLLFHDLARLHDKTKDHSDYERLYKLIEDNYLDHYAYNWYHNPRTVGAFAYFGPGQFANWYKDIVRSDGKHIVIGEAASAHHAWVVGALESAVRGVYQFLWKHSGKNDMAKAATEAYNNNDIPAPFGPIPAEYNRDEDIQVPRDANVKETARRGEWARMGVLFESIRLKQGGDTIDPTRIKDADIKPILDEIKPASSVAVGA